MAARIAVVEDEVSVLEMLRDLLEADGFSVLAMDHPDQAETIDATRAPDLFLIDLMLPGRSGIELAEQLRSSGFADTPMIAMSASKAMTRFASQSGLFQETLYKPFDMSALLNAVGRHIT